MEVLETKVKEQEQEVMSFHKTYERHERDKSQPVRQATPDRPPRSRYQYYQDDDGQDEDDDLPPRSNQWNIDPATINRVRNPNFQEPSFQEQPRRQDNCHTEESDEEEELTNIEQTKMESTIRAFEKKRDTEELTDNPTQSQIASFYGSLAHSANSSGIPMRPIHSIQKGKPVYPDKANRLNPQILQEYSSSLFYRLQQLIPESVAMYHDLVIQNQREEDGYTAIYQILSTTLPVLQDFRPKWGPRLTKKVNMYKFVNLMQTHTDQKKEASEDHTQSLN
jgi:hypothetical protein